MPKTFCQHQQVKVRVGSMATSTQNTPNGVRVQRRTARFGGRSHRIA